MKLLSMNIWCGKQFATLCAYITEKSGEIDIFCFQEVLDTRTSETKTPRGFRANLFAELQKLLPDFMGHYAIEQENKEPGGKPEFQMDFGKAIFVRRNLEVVDEGHVFVVRDNPDALGTRNSSIQYVQIIQEGKNYTIAHLHGLWYPDGKGDHQGRILQSEGVVAFCKQAKGKVIFGGDLNLAPETKSLAIIKEGMVDLIAKYEVPDTRSKLYTKPGTRMADYMFVSPDVQVTNFSVPYTEASDHLPMILDFM